MFSASKSGQYPGYLISRSVRLRSSASASFSRTPASAGNRKTWTWSGWVKRGALGSTTLFDGGSTGPLCVLQFNSDQLRLYVTNAGITASEIPITTAVFRDPSAWYHVVCAVDTTQATLANRIKLYVNGIEQTITGLNGTQITLNADLGINRAIATYIGVYSFGTSQYFDGYLTEINFIDGQALTPSSFGAYNAYGVWSPMKYNGTYGTNGFYLNFSDNSGATATTIGKDSSGNGNNWTPNNISVTSGATYDSMLDVPTPWGDGGNGRGNYAVLNPLISSTYQTLTNGNLTSKSNTSADSGAAYSTFSTGTTGKWYMEFVADTSTTTGYPIVGTTLVTSNLGNANGVAGLPGQNGGGSCGYRSNGQKYISSVSSSYGNSFATNDVIGVAVDCDNGAVYFSKNGTWQNSGDPTSGATKTGAANTWTGGSTAFYIGVAGYTSGNGAQANFGQRPFSYTPPSGFLALNTQNLPTPTISNGALYMAASLYTGNGTTVTVTNTTNGTSFLPDFVWVKSRNAAISHGLFDSNRGLSKALYSNATNAEFNYGTGSTSEVYALNSNGFSVGSYGNFNANGTTYVGWQWKAGGTPAVTNTSGSITSTISVGATQGFSIVTYTGTGANATVGHGLGVAPRMIIVKSRSLATSWPVYHASLTAAGRVFLDLTNAYAADSAWNSTAPTSSVFSIGPTGFSTNNSGATYVAYCFAQIAGFSAFGSYTGNGSTDGPFVFCGFRPRFVLIKRTDTTSDWLIQDTARSQYNVQFADLYPNLSNAENTSTATSVDALSNGFKLRGTPYNASGGTYIFAAFAENPFKYSLAR